MTPTELLLQFFDMCLEAPPEELPMAMAAFECPHCEEQWFGGFIVGVIELECPYCGGDITPPLIEVGE